MYKMGYQLSCVPHHRSAHFPLGCGQGHVSDCSGVRWESPLFGGELTCTSSGSGPPSCRVLLECEGLTGV